MMGLAPQPTLSTTSFFKLRDQPVFSKHRFRADPMLFQQRVDQIVGYGAKGSLEWHQEHPDDLIAKLQHAPRKIYRRGNS